MIGQTWACKLLLDKGADPLINNTTGRNVIFIAIEAGLCDIVTSIIEKYPNIDLNAPVTTEMQRYTPIHVAARYVYY